MWETGLKRIKLMGKSASNSVKPRVLFILHLPPPVHGPAQVGLFLRESPLVNESFETRYINLSASSTLEQVGHFSAGKIRTIFRLAGEVRRAVREWKPDLVYMTPSVTMPGLLKDVFVARAVRGKKRVLHLHNKGVAERQGRFFLNILYRMLFRDARVILLSRLLYPDIRKYVPEDRVSYCPNGVSVPSVDRVSGAVPRLLFLSNIIRSKGVSVLIEACRLLKERGIDFRCSLVGALSADYPGDSLSDEIREKGLEGRVIYEGPRYGDGKWEAMARADVFVHPTLNDSFPLVVLEAMGTGLPVVTTDEGAIPEMVRDGVDGLICPKGDPKALADALERLLSDAALRARMGESGKTRYRELYTLEQFEKRFVNILKDA